MGNRFKVVSGSNMVSQRTDSYLVLNAYCRMVSQTVLNGTSLVAVCPCNTRGSHFKGRSLACGLAVSSFFGGEGSDEVSTRDFSSPTSFFSFLLSLPIPNVPVPSFSSSESEESESESGSQTSISTERQPRSSTCPCQYILHREDS